MDDEDEEEQDNIEETKDEEPTPEDALGVGTHTRAGLVGQDDNSAGGAPAAKYDPRREVTYEVFAYELWPRINKKKLPYHSTLVWMEITSFIKGMDTDLMELLKKCH